MFRQRHLLSFPDDAVIEVGAVSYRQMVQELTNMKTMLLKLKRNLQEVRNSFTAIEHVKKQRHCTSNTVKLEMFADINVC